jgi:Flp pilus assembly pilin Flp
MVLDSMIVERVFRAGVPEGFIGPLKRQDHHPGGVVAREVHFQGASSVKRTTNLTNRGRMIARVAETPVQTGKAAVPQTLGSALRADGGQDLAEYAILIGLIALVVIGAVTLFGTQLVAAYNNIAAQLPFVGGS